MSEPKPLPDPKGLAADLRAALEVTRKQAEAEIARLNRKLAEREYAVEQNVASATERQAMQQELEVLQRALGQKESTLDRITDECRRLEDELEDQHVAFDGLKQEVAQKDTSLKAARDELDRLRRQLEEVQQQSVELTQNGSASLPPGLSLPPVEPDPPPSPAQHVVTFSAGLVSGLVVLGIAVLLLWGGIDLDVTRWLPGSTSTEVPVQERGEEPVVADTGNLGEEPSLDEDALEPPQPVIPAAAPAQPPPTERDRLRGGGLGPTLVVLDGGTFTMGKNSLSGGDSGPEHQVQVAPFLIGAYEVTFSQYDAFVRATGRRFPDDFGWGRGDRPVVGVSWSDAEAYADWLSRQTGRRYRLPSEAEWEYAALGGGRASYWWGFGAEPGRAVCFDCGTEWDNRSPAPVGSLPASPYGMFDTAGNVMEWVSDCYNPGYEGASGNSLARLDGDCTFRVARGGAFNKPARSMRVWFRTKLAPEARLNNLGFRVARDP